MASRNAIRAMDNDVNHFFFELVTHMLKLARVSFRARYFLACTIAITMM
jgi:hypothetical protein